VSVSGGSRHAYYGGGADAVLATNGRPAGGRLAPPGARPVVAYVEADHCDGVRKDGQPCGANPIKGGTLCVGHFRAVK
jgi:hypothetical protein